MTEEPDFAAAVARLPGRIAFVHHGRDPAVGLDCIGYWLAVYRGAGIVLDYLDEPYGRSAARRRERACRIGRKLARRFRPLPAAWRMWRDGDAVLLLGEGRGNSMLPNHLRGNLLPNHLRGNLLPNHLGVVIGPDVLHYDGTVHRTPLWRAAGRVVSAWRLKDPSPQPSPRVQGEGVRAVQGEGVDAREMG
jgi:hypothetical protein